MERRAAAPTEDGMNRTSLIERRWRRCLRHQTNRLGSGRRDRTILLLALQTGVRVSELINLNCRDVVVLGTGAHIRCEGKGRKQRSTPLRRDTVKIIEA